MMSGIKNRRKKNDDDELSEHSQNAEIVIRPKSDVTFEKTIQSEMKDDNEKTFNYKFNENDAVDYIALVEKKRARNKILNAKKEYQILLKRNKRLQISFQNDKASVSIRRRRSAVQTSDNFFNEIS